MIAVHYIPWNAELCHAKNNHFSYGILKLIIFNTVLLLAKLSFGMGQIP